MLRFTYLEHGDDQLLAVVKLLPAPCAVQPCFRTERSRSSKGNPAHLEHSDDQLLAVRAFLLDLLFVAQS